jgi:hypothetical protein
LKDVFDLQIQAGAALSAEDARAWESVQRLRDGVEALRNRKQAAPYQDLLKKAEALLSAGGAAVYDPAAFGPARAERIKSIEALCADAQKEASKLAKWNAEALTLEKAAEVRMGREAGARRKKLRERHSGACQALNAAPLSDEAWAALWPLRTLFRQDFEKEGDWNGTPQSANLPPGSARALEAPGGNKWFGRYARVEKRVWTYAHSPRAVG